MREDGSIISPSLAAKQIMEPICLCFQTGSPSIRAVRCMSSTLSLFRAIIHMLCAGYHLLRAELFPVMSAGLIL